MKFNQDLIVIVLTGVLLWLLFSRFVLKSAYTPATYVAAELAIRFKQFGKDLNWPSVAAADYAAAAAADNSATFAQLNQRAWELGHMGWRKDISTNTVWWLRRSFADSEMTADTDAFMTVTIGSQIYDVPRVVVCMRSVQDPRLGADCSYTLTPGACPATACGTTGTITDTWTANPATYGGTPCSSIPAPAAITTRTCAASPCPVPCTWKSTAGSCTPAPASSVCGTPGTITNTWSVQTPAAFGGSCAPTPASFNTPCAGRACVWVPTSYF
jgi:hypothetical protein